MKNKIKFYSLRLDVEHTERAPAQLFTAANSYPCELCISPSGRVCGMNSASHLKSKYLAEELIGVLLPKIREKYGQESRISICENYGDNTPVYGEKLLDKIESDSIKAAEIISRHNATARGLTVVNPA